MDQVCDFCDNKATYDSKTFYGSWAYMCPDCFTKYGVKIKGLYSRLKENDNDGKSKGE